MWNLDEKHQDHMGTCRKQGIPGISDPSVRSPCSSHAHQGLRHDPKNNVFLRKALDSQPHAEPKNKLTIVCSTP